VPTAKTVGDPISDFFALLIEPGHIATFERESGTIRFDVSDDKDVQHWYVTVTDGDVDVTHRTSPADAVVRVHRPDFEAIVTGRMNAQAALLRGVVTCEGSVGTLMMFQRALPGPPGSKGRVAPISSQTVMAQRRAG
jgi:hypothetical protein